MTEPNSTRPDSVRVMREIRDVINAQIAEMSYEELALWLTRSPLDDPRLAALAALRTDSTAAEEPLLKAKIEEVCDQPYVDFTRACYEPPTGSDERCTIRAVYSSDCLAPEME